MPMLKKLVVHFCIFMPRTREEKYELRGLTIYINICNYTLGSFTYYRCIQMSRSINPLTGRNDSLRKDGNWRARIEQLECSLGYVICGAHTSDTGDPCVNRPIRGEHRCHIHLISAKNNPQSKLKYPPNVRYGMNLKTFVQCHRCKDVSCPERIQGDTETDECPIEVEIYNQTMKLSEKYLVDGDFLQEGLLESVAYSLIRRFRAEKALAEEGMTSDEVVGYAGNGVPLYSKRAHPLLKHLSDINKDLNTFAKTLEFSPEAIHRRKDMDVAEDATNALSEILKAAHMNRIDSSD